MTSPDGCITPEEHFDKHGQTTEFSAKIAIPPTHSENVLRLVMANDDLEPVLDCGMVGDLFFRGGLCFISGASNAGKSAVAVTMAHSIQNGLPFAGFETDKTNVLYLAPERGERDILNRFFAIRQALGGEPMAFSPSSLSLWRKKNQAGDVIMRARQINAGAIFIDTQGAAMPGANRSAFEDASSFIAACASIQAETKAVVIVCAHPPKDNSSAIAGAGDFENVADCVLQITGGDNARELKVKKTKGSGQGHREGIGLQVESVGVNGRGEKVTAAFATIAGKPTDKLKNPSGSEQSRLLNIIKEVLADADARVPTPASLKLPNSIEAVADLKVVRERYESERDREKENTIQRGFRDARDALVRDGHIAIEGGYVWRLA